jgi:hypothetical protein
VLPGTVAPQLLEPVAREHPQILQRLRRVQQEQLPQRCAMDVRRESPDRLSTEQPVRIPVPEAPDHLQIS